jgi:hypothetical protein
MKLLRCALVLFSLLAPFTVVPSALAQTAVYGTVDVHEFGLTGGGYGNGSFKPANGSITGGAFYTFPSQSRFKAGIDGRFLYGPGYNGGSAYTGALRVGFVPNRNPLRPYFQIGGGVARTQLHQTICSGFACNTTTSEATGGVLQLDFGLDIRVSEHFDIRAFDYGADAGSSNGDAHPAVAFLGAGVVYHFHPIAHT